MTVHPAVGKAVALIAVASAVVLIVISMIVVDRRPRTHDAYIYAYSAGITPEVSGRVVWVGVHNDQWVHKGDILLKIDPEPFEMRLRQANAQVAALQAEIDLTGRQVTAQGSGAEAAAHEEDRARQQLTLARNTRARLEPLLAKGFVTAQQMDQARTDERAAQAQLAAATQQASGFACAHLQPTAKMLSSAWIQINACGTGGVPAGSPIGAGGGSGSVSGGRSGVGSGDSGPGSGMPGDGEGEGDGGFSGVGSGTSAWPCSAVRALA